MEQPPPLSKDPEFRPTLSGLTLPPVVDPGAYRRVLANPLLGFLGVGLWCGILVEAISDLPEQPRPAAILLLILLAIALLPRLFHFHCLDCGRTGRLTRWKEHLCPTVALRIVQGRPRRFRGPGPLAQTLFFGFLLAMVLMIASASGLTSR